MSTKVSVNAGQIAINDGATFLVTDSYGWIDETVAQGFFVADTRLLSYYEVSINRDRLLLLASSPINHHSALYQYTNPQFRTVNGMIPNGRLMIDIRRDVSGGIHEDIDITNHHSEQVEFQLMLAIRSDFADIFEVKSQQILTRGETETTWHDEKLITEYHNGAFHRGLITQPECADAPPRYANGRLFFDVVIDPGKTWHTCINFAAIVDGDVFYPQKTCAVEHDTEAKRVSKDFLAQATKLRSSNADIAAYYQQALVDMAALRIKVEANGQDFWMPAAGIPWFVAVFGRDSVIVSMQTMAVYPEFAHGTLLRLAQLQATEVDDWRDAQPGKMLHELRRDELTQLKQLPYTPYYGTIDTTILWIMTLAEAYQWSYDETFLHECRAPLENALAWIETYGDFDGDGFVEYQTRSSVGLRNQGWKDSGDAIVYPDGTQVEPPIALCEVQGYVYSAWRDAAGIYDVLGDPERAKTLRQKADDLYQRFNDRFWMEDEGFYCLGLDSKKQQIRAIASNPGHLLWSGIVPQERADRLVKRLFQPDLWCGWGIRTLSSLNPAYNPISYQLGSVWPHDNSAIAMGLKQYGYHQEANQIAEGIFAAASYFESGRMPELFGGIERQPGQFPVPYPDANVPQAWAAGSIFLLVRAMLGLEANAPERSLTVQPVLPDWLPDLELINLSVGKATVTLRFWREGEQTQWKVMHLEGELNVSAKPQQHRGDRMTTASNHYDVIIIGTGAGGGTLAYRLAPTGKKILVLERGDFLPREKANWSALDVYQKERYHTDEHWYDQDGKAFRPQTGYWVGGNTKLYGAALLRLRERDFTKVIHKDGISPAWELNYQDFEPYYAQAEKLYDVHGDRGEDPTEPPCSAPYPYPPVSHEPDMQEISDCIRDRGYYPFHLPLGLKLNEQDRTNSPCIRCDTFDGYPCLVGAKADAEVNAIRPAREAYDNLTLLTQAKVLRLLTSESGREITGVETEVNGTHQVFQGDIVVIACGAINSAVLLLQSANDRHPNGLANRSDQVGRNFMKHLEIALVALHTEVNHANFQKTIAVNDFYWGEPDFPYPMGMVQNTGNVLADMLPAEAPSLMAPFVKLIPKFERHLLAERTTGWWLQTEDLPDPNNRVRVMNGKTHLNYTLNNTEAGDRLLHRWTSVLKSLERKTMHAIPFSIYPRNQVPVQAVGHQCGTCRFGSDPNTSVLDLHCRTHDVDNLYVVDGSFFSSNSGVNPTLTIMANALRVGDHLAQRLQS